MTSTRLAVGGVRPMLDTDMPAVGRLFLDIFRGTTGEASPDLVAYLEALAFGSPSYDPAGGSLVFFEPDGSISSAFIAVPIRFVACDKAITGRLMCAFMTRSAQTAAGAGALGLTLRAKLQQFAFTDTAALASLRHWRAFGGHSVTPHNLEWTRRFRPAGAMLGRLSRRLLGGRSRGLARLAAPLDRLIRSKGCGMAARRVPQLSVEHMTDESFLDLAPAFVARYAIRPEWSRAELSWLLAMARQNCVAGRFAIDAVKDAVGRIIGCYVYYADGLRNADVLNVLALQGREADVLAAMFDAFDRRGFQEASGRAQPALMEGLVDQPLLTFRHKAFVCFSTRHADIVDAIRRGDVYIGGLAGEGWSRLMSDFHDEHRPRRPFGRLRSRFD